jgi:hypothetical protein
MGSHYGTWIELVGVVLYAPRPTTGLPLRLATPPEKVQDRLSVGL